MKNGKLALLCFGVCLGILSLDAKLTFEHGVDLGYFDLIRALRTEVMNYTNALENFAQEYVVRLALSRHLLRAEQRRDEFYHELLAFIQNFDAIFDRLTEEFTKGGDYLDDRFASDDDKVRLILKLKEEAPGRVRDYIIETLTKLQRRITSRQYNYPANSDLQIFFRDKLGVLNKWLDVLEREGNSRGGVEEYKEQQEDGIKGDFADQFEENLYEDVEDFDDVNW